MIAWLAAAALAQDDVLTLDYPIDAERFKPPVDTYGYALTESSTTLQNLQVGVGMWGNYSDDPVVLYWDGSRVVGPGPKFPDGLVDRRSVVDFQFGFGVADVFSMNVDMPVVVWQEGFEPASDASPSPSADLQSAGVGDLRLHPKFVITEIETGGLPVGVAILGDVTVPTGDTRSFIGEGTVTATPMVVLELADGSVSAREYHVRAAVNVGGRFKPVERFRDVTFGPEFVYRAGVGARPAPAFELGGDLAGSVSSVRIANAPLEILPWIKLMPLDFVTLTLGGGFGLVPGVGAPDYRAFAGGTLSPNFDPLKLDRDGDGIPNKLDACVNIPEDKDGFEDEDGCPEDDNDKDGILDPDDDNHQAVAAGTDPPLACPNDPEDFDGFQDDDGCPEADNDRDGLVDEVDQCPDDPEDFDGDRDQDGCPETPADSDGDGLLDPVDQCPYDPEDFDGWLDQDGCPELDNDGDRILDKVDACPNDPETYNGFVDEDGCPDEAARVVVQKEKIVISEKVFFEYNKAIILEISFALLDEVAQVMNDHPEVTKIRVEGHTDSDGSDTYNQKLSAARATSVMNYFVQAGVAAERLEAVGYGESRPIETNDTDEGKAMNRRVEFTILEREE
jgi:outer membrane protein OmpA-like peptidoglycan-associated protein